MVHYCFITWTSFLLTPALCRTHNQKWNFRRKLNSGQGLVTIDAVTFRAAFVGCRTEQVLLRTHLISSTVCVGRPGSEPQ